MITTTFLLRISVFFFVAILAQLLLTVLFAREAITTQEGRLCRVKCTLAALVYGCIATFLIWFSVIDPAK